MAKKMDQHQLHSIANGSAFSYATLNGLVKRKTYRKTSRRMSSRINGPISGFSNNETRTRYGRKSTGCAVQPFFNTVCKAYR